MKIKCEKCGRKIKPLTQAYRLTQTGVEHVDCFNPGPRSVDEKVIVVVTRSNVEQDGV